MRSSLALLPACAALLVLSTSCVFHIKGHHDRSITVNGVELEEQHEEVLEIAGWHPDGLAIEASLADLRFERTDGASRIVATVYETEQGDAALRYEHGVLTTYSRSGAPTALGDTTVYVSGPLPALTATTGMGDVEIYDVDVAGSARLETGLGDVSASKVSAGDELRFSTGMGDVVVRDTNARVVSAESGMGDVVLKRVTGEHAEASSGMGDVVVSGSEFHRLDATTGMGDVSCPNTRYEVGDLSSGLGDVNR